MLNHCGDIIIGVYSVCAKLLLCLVNKVSIDFALKECFLIERLERIKDTIDGITLTKVVSRIQWNQNKVTVRNAGAI